MKQLFIIIINYNGLNDTKQCINSIGQVFTKTVHISIIVVNNSFRTSIKKPINALKILYPHLSFVLIQNDKNLGFAQGNNIGMRYALSHGADFVLLLNNDTIVDRNFIDEIILFADDHDKAGIFGAKIYFEKGYEFHKNRYTESEKGNVIWYAGGIIDWKNVYAFHRGVDEVDIGRYNKPTQTQFVTGCCMLIKREVIEKIGFFDERYFMYLEDVDLCVRAKKAGYELWYVPSSIIWHKNAQSTGKSGSVLHVYYQTRNRLLFGMKFAPFFTKLALLKNTIHVVRTNAQRRSAVFNFYLQRFGKKSALHVD